MLKNITLSLMTLVVLVLVNTKGYSQEPYSYSDDFESYDVGAYLAKSSDVWTTWSGNEGGAEDAKISDTQANSGTKSVYLKSTSANGGPTDLVFPMPQLYDKGKVEFNTKVFVDENKGGYFNFQGAANIGGAWTIDVYFVDNGNFFVLENGNSTLAAAGTYPTAQWFDLTIIADLTINNWMVKINDETIGTFSTVINKISFIDFYPVNGSSVGGNGQASYYFDDFNIVYTPFQPKQTDGAILEVLATKNGLTGQESNIAGQLINVGLDIIKSFTVDWKYGNSTGSQSFDDLSIATLERYDFSFDDKFTLIEGDNDLSLQISSINGGSDNNADNDVKNTTITAVTPAPNKMVVGEELTGTWCGWCPRGAVALDYMSKKYPGYFQGIAVHGGDPMQVDDYLSGITATMKSITGENPGYPNLASMRSAVMDPASVEISFLERIQEAPAATLMTGADYDETSRNLSLSVSTGFINDDAKKYKVTVVLIENGVTGTGSQWAQANYYSHQSQNRPLVGAGHDWQAEPNPVPASDMVYNHVGRANLGGYKGVALSDSHNAGEVEVINFTYTIPDNINTDNVEFVAMILNPDGTVNNASTTTFAEALENGFVVTTTELENLVKVYPNPIKDNLNIELSNNENSLLEIYNIQGIKVFKQKLNHSNTSVDVSSLEEGMYILHIYSNNEQIVNKKLVILR
ncbi:MAG TPA: Omp28-related outer membrane protein [Bacteroidetes bacterium]|nr:Omp28-related outer membrane protein [Bacteroidota bacterium]